MDAVGTVELVLQEDYRFAVDFGPNCLSSSLLFSLRKFKNHSILMRTTADARLLLNAQGRLRMDRIEVDIHLGAPAATIRFLDRALAQFEDFCVVTQSVRTAIPARVRVFDSSGRLLTD